MPYTYIMSLITQHSLYPTTQQYKMPNKLLTIKMASRHEIGRLGSPDYDDEIEQV